VLVAAAVLAPLAVSAPAHADSTITCDGDGVSGKRVQLVYVHGDAQTDRYADLLPTFQEFSTEIDADFVEASTRLTTAGGIRHVRFVHDASCHATVDDVTIPQSSMTDENAVSTAIAAQGYNRADRKYLVWWDADACGLSFGNPGDDSPGADNGNNSGPNYSMLGAQGVCFGWPASAHELLHSLGAVQRSAPHATTNGHCWDDEDIMCYDDGGIPPGQTLTKVCAGAPENQIDCNEDDYFNTDPAPGSYLATHWNVANSEFLIDTPVPATCQVTYTTTDNWGSGANVNVTIANTGTTAINGWTLGFDFLGNESITTAWNATYTQTQQAVLAHDAGYNSTIPAGGSVSFGLSLTYSGDYNPPITFTLNGSNSCA